MKRLALSLFSGVILFASVQAFGFWAPPAGKKLVASGTAVVKGRELWGIGADAAARNLGGLFYGGKFVAEISFEGAGLALKEIKESKPIPPMAYNACSAQIGTMLKIYYPRLVLKPGQYVLKYKVKLYGRKDSPTGPFFLDAETAVATKTITVK
jgi:hypothetical protein